MDENVIFLAVLIVLLFAFAFFAADFRASSGLPRADAPNPNAEFNVIRGSVGTQGGGGIQIGLPVFGGSNPPPRSPTPPPPSTVEEKEKEYQRNFKIFLQNPRSRNPDTEYIDVEYNSPSKESVDISDWTLSNKSGFSITIGSVTNFPGIGSTPNTSRLTLAGSGRVHIITGRSPRGENFRLNKCSEYFSQHQTYVPSISVFCPSLSREPGVDALDDECFDFVRRFGSCRIPTQSELPAGARNADCREFISKTINYSGCTSNHRNDLDFFKNEWWVYLNRPEHVWSDIRDTITLTNERGIVIATASYD